MIGDDLHEKFGPRDADDDARKASFSAYYDAINRQLNGSNLGDWTLFLNFGYAVIGSEQRATMQVPRHFPNRNSAQLVLELIGDLALTGKRILDIGCGRGGLLSVLHLLFKPSSLSGLDLSAEAVAFAARTHAEPLFDFRQGDAENLPYPAACFDVVTNMESSHSYPDIGKFYTEVSRVLTAGGWFLYTDVLSAQAWDFARSSLDELGFELARDYDITSNVLLSHDQVTAQREKAFPGWKQQDSGNGLVRTQDYLEVSDSYIFQRMRENACQYRILWFHKCSPDSGEPGGHPTGPA